MVVCRDSGPRIIISCHIKNDTFINNSYANKLRRFSLCANNLFHGSLGLHASSLSKEGGWVNEVDEVDKVHEVKRQKVSSDSIIYSFLWIPHLLSRNWRLKGTWFHDSITTHWREMISDHVGNNHGVLFMLPHWMRRQCGVLFRKWMWMWYWSKCKDTLKINKVSLNSELLSNKPVYPNLLVYNQV